MELWEDDRGKFVRDGPLEKWWGGGIFSLPKFFFGPFPVQEFFLATALCMNFFFEKILSFAQFAIELIKNNATLFY